MYNNRNGRDCGCNEGNDAGRGGGCGGGRGPCNPNPHEYSYDKVVGTWKTVRHYKITTYDTIEPVCTDGMADDDLSGCVGGDCCGR